MRDATCSAAWRLSVVRLRRPCSRAATTAIATVPAKNKSTRAARLRTTVRLAPGRPGSR